MLLSALRSGSALTRNEFLGFCGQKKSSSSRNLCPRNISSLQHHLLEFSTVHNTDKMAAEGASANGTTPGERHAIGISFGNSNSSIAYTTNEDKAEVIANEDGGMLYIWDWIKPYCC